MLFQYDGNGLYIDGSQLKLHYKDTVLIETPKNFTVTTPEMFDIKCSAAEVKGDPTRLYGKGKEIYFEGSGKVYTQGKKTYIVGTEIHFNK